MLKEHIKTNFHGQDVSYNMYCSSTAVQWCNDRFCQVSIVAQVYVEKCKYTNAENWQCNMLSDDDDGFFEV